MPLSHLPTGPVLQALMQLSDLSKGRVLFEVKKAHGEGVVQENTGHLGGFKNYFYDILVCDLTIFDIYIYT